MPQQNRYFGRVLHACIIIVLYSYQETHGIKLHIDKAVICLGKKRLKIPKGHSSQLRLIPGREADSPEVCRLTKGAIRSCRSKKGRQYNDQSKKNKRTNNDLQNTTQN